MRIILALILSISFSAHAKKSCWLTDVKTQVDDFYVDCRIGPSPYKRICPAINGELDGGHYIIEVVTAGPELGIETREPWVPGTLLGENQRFECSLDLSIETKAEAQQAADAAAELARENAKASRIDALKTMCDNQPASSPLDKICDYLLKR